MRQARHTSATLLVGIAFAFPAIASDDNTTGLPLYAHTTNGRMDARYRSLPNGQNCIHFAATSADPLSEVEAWYRKQLPGAKPDDINHNSLYGQFKLDGMKLLVGADIVNVYRMMNQTTTSIELFKCKNSAEHG